MRNAVLRATGLDADSAEASISEDSPTEITSSAAEESSTESLRLVTPMVRFLVSESEDNPSPSLDTPMQEVLSEADPTSSEEVESLDSWSDPDRTLATINKNVGLAVRLF